MRVTIYFFSKLKAPYASLAHHFLRLLGNDVKFVECGRKIPKIKERKVICLDPSGKLLELKNLKEEVRKEKVAFVIGGPDGIPASIECDEKVSLSPLVVNHQLAAIILLEQLYRIFKEDHPYTMH